MVYSTLVSAVLPISSTSDISITPHTIHFRYHEQLLTPQADIISDLHLLPPSTQPQTPKESDGGAISYRAKPYFKHL
jgi:hypothetical protein